MLLCLTLMHSIALVGTRELVLATVHKHTVQITDYKLAPPRGRPDGAERLLLISVEHTA
jgi:hypothetical protein